jgi:hypothetical protein
MDQWQQYIKPNSDLEEIISLLRKTQSLPELQISSQLPPYVGGAYARDTNTVELNPRARDPQNTLAHEATHAMFKDMRDKSLYLRDRQNKREPVSSADMSFVDAYNKLDPQLSRVPRMYYPDNEYNQYRHSFHELPAFAVGRMADPRKSLTRGEYFETSPGGQHLDATLATEQAILRDLYNRTLTPQSTTWQSLKSLFQK